MDLEDEEDQVSDSVQVPILEAAEDAEAVVKKFKALEHFERRMQFKSKIQTHSGKKLTQRKEKICMSRHCRATTNVSLSLHREPL